MTTIRPHAFRVLGTLRAVIDAPKINRRRHELAFNTIERTMATFFERTEAFQQSLVTIVAGRCYRLNPPSPRDGSFVSLLLRYDQDCPCLEVRHSTLVAPPIPGRPGLCGIAQVALIARSPAANRFTYQPGQNGEASITCSGPEFQKVLIGLLVSLGVQRV